jgi:rod shape-determining protein MreC
VASLIAASLAIITVDYRAGDQGPLAAAGRAVNSAIAPLQDAVTSVVRPVTDFFSNLAKLPSLASRNDALQAQVDDLKTAQLLNGELKQQVESVERILGLQQTMTRTVAARVIASGVSNFEWTVTIDAGSNDGIDENMAVVTGDETGPRLVGRVISVTPESSVVQLLIDRDFVVPGKLTTSQEAGTVEGRGAEDLRMELLGPGIEVSATEPESVVTLGYEVNGQQGLFPPGILIGTVSRAFSEPDGVDSFVTVRPAVDFSTLQYVLVMIRDRDGVGTP